MHATLPAAVAARATTRITAASNKIEIAFADSLRPSFFDIGSLEPILALNLE